MILKTKKIHLNDEKLSIPTQKKITLPILDLLKNGKALHINQIEKKLAEYFKLSREETQTKKSSGGEGLFHNRIRWAAFYLRKAGLIESHKPAYAKITSDGIGVLKEKPIEIDIFYLEKFPKFQEWKRISQKPK